MSTKISILLIVGLKLNCTVACAKDCDMRHKFYLEHSSDSFIYLYPIAIEFIRSVTVRVGALLLH